MNKSQEINANDNKVVVRTKEDSILIMLDSDLLHTIIGMVFDSSNFIDSYETIYKISKQFKEIVLKIGTILTQINIYNNKINTHKIVNKLEEILKKTRNITILEFKNINIYSNSLYSLVAALKNNTTLTTLRFNNCNSKETYLYKNISVITSKLIKTLLINKILIELDLHSNSIDDNETEIIAEYLKRNDIKLTILNLSNNYIGFNGCELLADALKINKTLTRLNIGNNNLYDHGVELLAEALKINLTILELYLYNNLIKIEGVIPLAEALKVNTTLTLLDLTSNGFGNEGIKVITKALITNKILKTLVLCNITSNYLYHIDNDGAIALADLLKINQTLTNLNLRWNNIKNEGAIALSEALETNTTMITLDLSDNSIDDMYQNITLKRLKPYDA